MLRSAHAASGVVKRVGWPRWPSPGPLIPRSLGPFLMNTILLSFDAEEFDIPLEFGRAIGRGEQMEVAARGLERVLDLLDGLRVPATFFTTASFAGANPELAKRIATGHELASHGLTHGAFHPEDLAGSREILEELTGASVVGFRRARFAVTDERQIAAAGYLYSSSVNPTLVPGRYNNLRSPRRPFRGESGLVQIPLSVTPRLRVPLFWLSFKNLPATMVKRLAMRTLRHDGVLTLLFHPWEFAELSGYGLPRIVRRIDGQRLADRLERFLLEVGREGRFSTCSRFAREWRGNDE